MNWRHLKALNILQSHLTGSSWIQLILLIKRIQSKIEKTHVSSLREVWNLQRHQWIWKLYNWLTWVLFCDFKDDVQETFHIAGFLEIVSIFQRIYRTLSGKKNGIKFVHSAIIIETINIIHRHLRVVYIHLKFVPRTFICMLKPSYKPKPEL